MVNNEEYGPMDPVWKALWLDALRSGEYQQTKYRLQRTEEDVAVEIASETSEASVPAGYCCLGVLCEVYRKEAGRGHWERRTGFRNLLFTDGSAYDYSGSELPEFVTTETGVRGGAQGDLVNMNDGDALDDSHVESFAQIADWIEENL